MLLSKPTRFGCLITASSPPEADGKRNLDHVADMLGQLARRQLPSRTVLMDGWYATTALLKQRTEANTFFYCPLQSSRLVDDSGGQPPYQPVGLLTWSAAAVAQGKLLKVKGTPKDAKRKRLRALVSTHQTGCLVANEVAQDDTHAEQESNGRWLLEQFPREANQLTGLQACQCRLARSQRTPIARALRTCTCLKRLAGHAKTTTYQLKQRLLDDYMHPELAQPTLRFA